MPSPLEVAQQIIDETEPSIDEIVEQVCDCRFINDTDTMFTLKHYIRLIQDSGFKIVNAK